MRDNIGDDPLRALISRMIGQRLVDIIGYGWLSRRGRQTKFVLSRRQFDFVLDSDVIVFRSQGGMRLAAWEEDEFDAEEDDDYLERGEPCTVSLFPMLSFSAGEDSVIKSVQVYVDRQTTRPEAILLSLAAEVTHLFLRTDYVDGLHLSSTSEEKNWREGRDQSGEAYDIVTCEQQGRN